MFWEEEEKRTMPGEMQKADIRELTKELASVVGDQHVLVDPENLELHSLDFSEERLATAGAVVLPRSTEEVARVAKLTSSLGFAIVPRGGGMSYTLGYVPERENSVIVDLRRMNRILEINTEDLYITAESGVTWKQIYEALLDKAYRIPFIGTISGIAATVGGGLGNNCVGIGKGEVDDNLLGVEVVLSNGRIIQTGGRATDEPIPSLRHFGPDLTGLFVHDAGAFGIKTKATFRLVRKPGGHAFASFGFQKREPIVTAMCESSRLDVASELLASGSYHHEQFASEPAPSKKEQVEIFRKIVRLSSSRLRGIRDILRCIRPGGINFLRHYQYSFHAIVEAFDQRAADRGLAAIKKIARKNGGKELPPILPIILRADPFPPVDRLIQGIQGVCSIPSNCLVPLSRAQELTSHLEKFFQNHSPMMQKHGLEETCNYIMVKGMFGIEPILYWKDKLNPLRLSILSPERREQLERIPANLEARKIAIDLRRKMHKVFRDFNGAHFGIGKYYSYREALRDEESWNIMEGLKNFFDPRDLMNPGALGFNSSYGGETTE